MGYGPKQKVCVVYNKGQFIVKKTMKGCFSSMMKNIKLEQLTNMKSIEVTNPAMFKPRIYSTYTNHNEYSLSKAYGVKIEKASRTVDCESQKFKM